MAESAVAAPSINSVNMTGRVISRRPGDLSLHSSSNAAVRAMALGDSSEVWESDLNDDSSIDSFSEAQYVNPRTVYDQRMKLVAAEKRRIEIAKMSSQQASNTPKTKHGRLPADSKSTEVSSATSSGSVASQPGAYAMSSSSISSFSAADLPAQSVAVEAVAIDEDEEARKAQAMEERLDMEISARRDLEEMVLTSQKKKSKLRCTKKKPPISVSLLLILGGIGAVLYFSLAPKADAEVKQPEDVVLLYDPPTLEDCYAIRNGSVVSGQKDMIFKELDVTMDISTYSELLERNTRLLLFDIQDKANTMMIPMVIGCMEYDEFGGKDFGAGADPAARYLVGNGRVLNVTLDNTSVCEISSPEPCYRVVVHYDFWLKEDKTVFDLIVTAENSFGIDLEKVFEAGNLVEEVAVVSVTQGDDN